MTLQVWQMLNCGTDADYFNAESSVLCSAYLDFFKSYCI